MKTILWMHEDALRADHLVFHNNEKAPFACFVWDAEYFQNMQYGRKRLLFIYQSLCELPVVIYEGNTMEVLRDLVKERQAERLLMADTPNPVLKNYGKNCEDFIAVETVPDAPFVTLKEPVKLKRFFLYWNKVKKSALTMRDD